MTDAHCHVSCGDPAVRELLVGRDFFGVHPWETLGGPCGAVSTDETSEKAATGKTGGIGELCGKRLSPDPNPTLIAPTSTLTDPISTLIDPTIQNLLANPKAGVGEIGLDRLKCRAIPPLMREVFEAQLALAFDLRRPVVLHGAKCWGQVVAAVKVQSACAAKPLVLSRGKAALVQGADAKHPAPSTSAAGAKAPGTRFLFHGFSRSDGLIPDIVKLNGFISVGPAVLNDHAVNYRELVKKIPLDRLLVETDRTSETPALATSNLVGTSALAHPQLVGTSALAHPQLVGTSALARPPAPTIYDILAKVAELRGVSAAELEKITDENAERFMGASL